jgi:hypothetical protein
MRLRTILVVPFVTTFCLSPGTRAAAAFAGQVEKTYSESHVSKRKCASASPANNTTYRPATLLDKPFLHPVRSMLEAGMGPDPKPKERNFHMIISEKQQEANRQNAQQSTGPKTPEGKAAVRLNALTYGLRARDLLIFEEDPEEYKQLWADLLADWQPQNRTERLHLEQMATSQWMLARIARGESRIYQADIKIAEQFALLREASTQRVRFERSFTSAMRDLKQLQKERQARCQQQAKQTAPAAQQSAEAPVSHPGYPAPEGAEDHPVFCAPVTPDTR